LEPEVGAKNNDYFRVVCKEWLRHIIKGNKFRSPACTQICIMQSRIEIISYLLTFYSLRDNEDAPPLWMDCVKAPQLDTASDNNKKKWRALLLAIENNKSDMKRACVDFVQSSSNISNVSLKLSVLKYKQQYPKQEYTNHASNNFSYIETVSHLLQHILSYYQHQQQKDDFVDSVLLKEFIHVLIIDLHNSSFKEAASEIRQINAYLHSQ
jgi:hypothetical protein